MNMKKDKLTPKQKILLNEIEEIKSIIFRSGDIFDIKKYVRIDALERDKQLLIRTYVIYEYLLINEYFDIEISSYFFKAKPNIIKTKKFRILYDKIVSPISFNQKIWIFKTIMTPPKTIIRKINKVKELRNILAHSMLPTVHKKNIMYKNRSIFELATFKKFVLDMDEVRDYIFDRLKIESIYIR